MKRTAKPSSAAPSPSAKNRRPQSPPAEPGPDYIAAAKADKRILIESCFSIVDGDSQQVVPFIYRPVQDLYWRNRSQCDLILKSRKLGFSALIDAEFLADCILEPHTNALVVAHRDEDAKILFDRVRWMRDHLDFDVPISSDGEGYLSFPQTESSFQAITAGGKDPRRGSDINRLHLSERSRYPNESFLAAVEGACTKNARRVIETTANGAGTPFQKFWLRTKRGETAYKWHFFPWWMDPSCEVDVLQGGLGPLDESESQLVEAHGLSERKLAWRRLQMRKMSNPDLFPQEYPSNDSEAFLSSGRMVFDWLSLHRMQQALTAPKWRGRLKNMGEKITLEPNAQGPLAVWGMPRDDRRYMVSADVAEGLPDGAWSVADVLDVATWEQVAQWRGHVSPTAFGDVLGDLGAFYNWAQVAPEVNNHGIATCARLSDEGYPKLYTREDSRRQKAGTDYGWLTTRQSKIMMVNQLGQAIRDLTVKVNSADTIEELKSFVHTEGGDMEAQGGSFSDCVMSLAIGVALLGDMRETPPAARQRFREAMGLRPYRVQGQAMHGGYGMRKA